MTSVLLLLVLMLPTHSDFVAHQTWDQLSWEYNIVPLSLAWSPQSGGGIALQGGFDAQGRAAVTFDPVLRTASDQQIVKTTLHESGHTMLRLMGVPYGGVYEENIVNSFAYCRMGVLYFPVKPCPEIMEIFKPLHR